MLIAIHGFTETDLSWREVFAASEIAIKTPLLPGHGHRPCPPGSCAEQVVAELAERYAAEGPFDLLGYSLGGRIALHLAIEHPHLVRRLILVSCRAGISDPEERQQRLQQDEGLAMMLEENGIGQFVAWWENNPALRPFRPLPRSMQEHLRCRRLNQDPLLLAANLRAFSQGVTTPLWDRLDEVTMPCLAITGSADSRYNADMERMVQAMPHGKLSIVPECGHAVHRECQASLVNIVRGFLAQK